MGCDIHLYREKHVDGKWLAVDKWAKDEYGDFGVSYDDQCYTGRNYELFGLLAKGVRREHSFSFEKRGLPFDACDEIKACSEGWDCDDHWELSFYTSESVINRPGVVARPSTHNGEWTGLGLPPVGTVCEVFNDDLSGAAWEKCTILFTGKHRVVYDSESCCERVGYMDCLKFRPIRTAEQIAAEDREKALSDLCLVINNASHMDCGTYLAQAIIDAGYRKVEGGEK